IAVRPACRWEPGPRLFRPFASLLRQPDLRVDESVGRYAARLQVRVDRVQPLGLEDRQDFVDYALEPLHAEVAERAVRSVLDEAELLLRLRVVRVARRRELPERVQLSHEPLEQ